MRTGAAPQSSDPAPSSLNPAFRRRLLSGITGHLYLVLLVVSLLPLTLGGILMVRTSVDTMRRSVRELQLAVLSDVSHRVERELEISRIELQTIASYLLEPGFGSDEARLALAAGRLTASNTLDWISVYGPDLEQVGTFKANGVRDPQLPARLPEALAKGLEAAPFAAGEVMDGGGYPSVMLAVPVDVAGRRLGVVAAGASLERLCEQLSGMSQDRFTGIPNTVYVVDSRPALVAHPEAMKAASHRLLGNEGIFRAIGGSFQFRVPFGLSPSFIDGDGRAWLGAIQSLPDLGWAVVVEVDQEVAYAEIRRMRLAMVLAALVVALGVSGVALLVARRVTRPVRDLEAATRKLAQREFSTRVEVKRDDEIGQLAVSFNQMALELAQSEAKLLSEARIRQDLSRYLAPEVVEEIVTHPERMKLGGERRTVTVLFADIVGFTGLSERLEPEHIVGVLNELFTFATEIVLRRGGIIDKFIGDCIMAVFGAPHHHDEDARHAVEAAEDLMRWLEVGNRRWQKHYGIELKMAIGINTGPAVAGNIGSEKRMDYTVIGDTVNIAARLESLAKEGQILVSQSTRDAIGDAFEVESAGLRELKGRTASTMVYVINPE